MNARCVKCSKRIEFNNTRGNKLENMKCGCGGGLEIAYSTFYERGISPLGNNSSELWDYSFLPEDKKGWRFCVYKSKSGFFILDKSNNKFLAHNIQ